MSDNIPSSYEISEAWKQFIRDSADCPIEREMIAMADAEDAAAAENRGNSRTYVDREREDGHDSLVRDYFCEEPIFNADHFRRRFRMRRKLFMQIVEALGNHSSYFLMRQDATGRNGLSPLQKCTAAIRMLAYAVPGDLLDEYIRMGNTTATETLNNFCSGIIAVYGPRYLRTPNNEDTQRLLQMHEERHGFPGMLGSLDCMHWEWRNCPVAWKGQYTRGDHGVPTIVLEAVASADLWIWHAFFGVPGSGNDINVLHGSPLFNPSLQGNAPEVQFNVNGRWYNKGYYLTDGIYPTWASFVKSYPVPDDPIRKKFAERQEAARKDVERAFGVLQARWAVIRYPARQFFKVNIRNIMLACIILHNMIIEDEGEGASNWSDEDAPPVAPIAMGSDNWEAFEKYLKNYNDLCSKNAHLQLQSDLTEHIWTQFISNSH